MVRPSQPPINQQQPPLVVRETSSQPEDTNSPNHPLFLHQNDHPGLILISKKLVGLENYSSWRRCQILLMQPLLNATKAYGMLRQEEKQRETTTPKYMTPAIMSTYTNTNKHPQFPYRQNMPSSGNCNYRSDSNHRRSAFRQGVYYGNCQKEGYYKSECYQLVGYPIGYPFHSKVKPVNKGADSKARVVNMVVGTDGASTSGKYLNDDAAVFAKMDNLQNQLNQVIMMLQNSQGVCDPKVLAAGRYFFIASIISYFKMLGYVTVEPLTISALHFY
ncbi:hypothetical protein Tco_0715124 [Tanacetum coccineum]